MDFNLIKVLDSWITETNYKAENQSNIHQEFLISLYDFYVSKLKHHVKNEKLKDFIINCENMYISGSFVIHCLLEFLKKPTSGFNDIDIYLDKSTKTQLEMMKEGIDDEMLRFDKIQILCFKFNNYSEIVKLHDLNMLKVILNFKKKLIYFHPDFSEDYLKGEWRMMEENGTNKKRIEKYKERNWFNLPIKVIKNTENIYYFPCQRNASKLNCDCGYCIYGNYDILENDLRFPHIGKNGHILDLRRIKCICCNCYIVTTDKHIVCEKCSNIIWKDIDKIKNSLNVKNKKYKVIFIGYYVRTYAKVLRDVLVDKFPDMSVSWFDIFSKDISQIFADRYEQNDDRELIIYCVGWCNYDWYKLPYKKRPKGELRCIGENTLRDYSRLINSLIKRKYYNFKIFFVDGEDSRLKEGHYDGDLRIKRNCGKESLKQYMRSMDPLLQTYGCSQTWFDCGWLDFGGNCIDIDKNLSVNLCALTSIMMCESDVYLDSTNNLLFEVKICDLLKQMKLRNNANEKILMEIILMPPKCINKNFRGGSEYLKSEESFLNKIM